jgi:hypothetical protein
MTWLSTKLKHLLKLLGSFSFPMMKWQLLINNLGFAFMPT